MNIPRTPACCPCRRTASPQTQRTAARHQAKRSHRRKKNKEMKEIKELIAKGDIVETFFQLKSYLNKSNLDTVSNDLLLLENRYYRNRDEIIKGIIDNKEATIENNSIVNSLIQVVDIISKGEVNSPLSEQVDWENIFISPIFHPDNIKFVLKLRETGKQFIVHASYKSGCGEIAEELARKLLDNKYIYGYDWSLEFDGRLLPAYHTLISSGIRNNSVVYISGNHRMPTIQPMIDRM